MNNEERPGRGGERSGNGRIEVENALRVREVHRRASMRGSEARLDGRQVHERSVHENGWKTAGEMGEAVPRASATTPETVKYRRTARYSRVITRRPG